MVGDMMKQIDMVGVTTLRVVSTDARLLNYVTTGRSSTISARAQGAEKLVKLKLFATSQSCLNSLRGGWQVFVVVRKGAQVTPPRRCVWPAETKRLQDWQFPPRVMLWFAESQHPSRDLLAQAKGFILVPPTQTQSSPFAWPSLVSTVLQRVITCDQPPPATVTQEPSSSLFVESKEEAPTAHPPAAQEEAPTAHPPTPDCSFQATFEGFRDESKSDLSTKSEKRNCCCGSNMVLLALFALGIGFMAVFPEQSSCLMDETREACFGNRGLCAFLSPGRCKPVLCENVKWLPPSSVDAERYHFWCEMIPLAPSVFAALALVWLWLEGWSSLASLLTIFGLTWTLLDFAADWRRRRYFPV